MEFVIISLLGFSIIILILSFFLKDPHKQLQEELDQMSLQHLQELSQIKKRLRLLEEEILMSVDHFQLPSLDGLEKKEVNSIIQSQVISLARQGIPIDMIAKQSSLSLKDVQSILQANKGELDE
ncbi:hypothetical protein [Bacillus sp. 03113]|uniref:hypothetical protein n=1 Tax=Bacillus sp. 03113 TaxID=2578211 RepID=UPI00215D519F|nr:hypothetical protein [Bacillus sp. 03113]